MTKLRVLLSRVVALFAGRGRDAELHDEIQAHLDLLAEERVRQGMSPAEARAAARREFGGVDQVKEAYRDIRAFRWLEDGGRDIRFGLRTLRKRPLVGAVIILTLALGLGVNIAIFAAVNGILLSPSRFAEPGRLVIAWASNPEIAARLHFPDRLPQSPASFYDYQRETRALAALTMMRADRLTLTGSGEAQTLGAVRVSGDFFTVLGVRPVLGRAILPSDDQPAAPRVVVLSWGFWQRLGADPSLVGRTLAIQGTPSTVIGVMSAQFDFPRGAELPLGYAYAATPDIWTPLAFSARYLARGDRTTRNLVAIGRLAPGVTREQAQVELSTINARLQREYPASDGGWSVRLDPLDADLVTEVRTPLLFLHAAVSLVLLLACANVGNVLMAQASGRRREVIIRTALGAGRGRVIRQLLAESLVLAGFGGAAGVVAAVVALRGFAALMPPRVPGVDHIALDGRVAVFAVGLSVLTAIVSGLMPALTAARLDLAAALHDGARTDTGGPGGRRTRHGLLMLQNAVAVILVAAAGLLIRSFIELAAVNPGFSPDGVLAIDLDLAALGATPGARAQFASALIDRLHSVPGIISVGAVSDLPMNGVEDIEGLAVEGQPPRKPDELLADQRAVTPGYFETMKIPLVAGRLFAPSDRADGPEIVIINDTMARNEWPGQDPVGRRLRLLEAREWRTVIGVVGTVRNAGPQAEPRAQVYELYAQHPSDGALSVVARVDSGDPVAIATTVRAIIQEVDPNQPIGRVRTLETLVSNSVASPRFVTALLTTFAVLALVLAAVGIYGVTSYVVRQRTREFGLRIALGAEPRAMMRQVVADSMRITGVGLLVGLIGAAIVSRVAAGLLYGVGPADPVAFAGAIAILVACSLAAAAIPAWRAMRVDPMVALRHE